MNSIVYEKGGDSKKNKFYNNNDVFTNVQGPNPGFGRIRSKTFPLASSLLQE
jgi:hypothetical protein